MSFFLLFIFFFLLVQYFTNILGQKFYSEEDLMRNIKDAKEKGLSIYAPVSSFFVFILFLYIYFLQ